MGEAKRKRASGCYPEPTEAMAAARRFWCGRAPVLAQDFTAPDGVLAITLNVVGTDPSTCMVDLAAVVPILDDITP